MELLEQIREMSSRLATLTPEELADLRSKIIQLGEQLDTDEASVEDIAAMQEIAGIGSQVMAEQQTRDEQAAQAQADRQSAREQINALNPPVEEPENPEAPESDPENPEDPDAAADPEGTPTDPGTVPEPVAASALDQLATALVDRLRQPTTQVERMAARQRRPRRSPEAGNGTPPNRAALTATGALARSLRHHDPATPIEDRMVLAEAMTETLRRMPRHGAARGDVLLASATWHYPEDRQLDDSDAWGNTAKMEKVNSLTATGGICLPVNVDYSVPTWATDERPLRDGLPSYEATRGGVRYVQPPDIAALAGATGIWTEATDASPGASTKPVISIACGSEELVYTEAISTRLGFGNMQSRFAPEQVAANTDLAVAAAARIAENNLLNLIAAQCVAGVTTATTLGAARDLLTALHQGVAAYRNAHRIPDSQTITAIFPVWLRTLIKIDMLRELAHDNSSSWNVWMISDAQVDELLSSTGVNPIFHLDGQPSGVSGGVAQTFAIQTGSAAIETFPTKLVWYLFPEGFFQFLDGGRLDLGVVRDSTLDATNDYETFVETFEGVAYRGFANGAIQYVSTLCASGGSGATIGSVTCA